MLAQWAWRERSWRAFALAGDEMSWLIGFLQFVLVAVGVLPHWQFLLSPADGLLLYGVLLFFFVEHFIAEREAAARARLAAIDAERRRILQDMHDGMGSQLIAAARLVRQPEIDRALGGAQHRRRAAGHALDRRFARHDRPRSCCRCWATCAFACSRASKRSASAWNGRRNPCPRALTRATRTRAGGARVQEALNNAVRHAQPKAIGVAIRPHDEGVLITVGDDGIGFKDIEAAPGIGRGLGGMRQRVAEIGGRLGLARDSAGGTVVSLWLPPAAPAAA